MGTSFSSNLTESSRAVQLFKINGYSATRAMDKADSLPSKRLAVGGYEWEVHYTPCHDSQWHYWVAFKLVLLGPPRRSDVKAALRCRLMHRFSGSGHGEEVRGGTCFRDESGDVEGQVSHAFRRADESSAWVRLIKTNVLESSGVIRDDMFTVECTITVITERPPDASADALPPRSGLNHHLGELLQEGTGADVALVVSGESFLAHKAILASRSPVFMANFFGRVEEKRSQSVVELKAMDAAAFRAMLRFIYTDMAPEALDQETQDGNAMAQRLLAAADRYGIVKLKLICEDKLMYDGVSIDTAATTLVLAERHCCSRLKAKCLELIAANLDGVMATEGYRHLTATCPSVLSELLKARWDRMNL
jgi:speckle-type POZ protein